MNPNLDALQKKFSRFKKRYFKNKKTGEATTGLELEECRKAFWAAQKPK